ncbi:pentapeptide repeat-containing protein [Nesterenkonia pannonica]|uniref:pentapeptide repeat-containing protein n=1 Tax=Nesterenkonia pannonica TaxID=1548602 RepID=UPI00216434C5|nr:pentapeptide repeat-containing protein [Nesterenkonia pannonica]
MRGADLWGANLRGADLWRANLRRADLREANLQGADLRRAIWDGMSTLNLPSGIYYSCRPAKAGTCVLVAGQAHRTTWPR